MPLRVVQVQSTPNPNAEKYVLDGVVSDRPISFFNAEAAWSHPLARRLFAIPGVCAVLLLGDFVTINKGPAARWAEIRKRVKQELSASAES